MGKFKKGLFIGGLLGAATAWMALTPKGREARDKLIDAAADIYDGIKTKVLASDEWKKMNRNQYVKMVRETVDKYAVSNPTVQKGRAMLIKILSAQWDRLKEEMEKRK